MNDTPEQEIDPEVRQLLEETVSDLPEVPAGKRTELNIDEEAAHELEQSKQVSNRERVEFELSPQWDPVKVGDQEVTGPWDVWHRMVKGLGEVKVTENDKDLFLKAAMHDQEVELEIEMPLNMVVRVRSIGAKMMRALSLAMIRDERDGIIASDTLWSVRLQYYSLMLQVAGVGDSVTGFIPKEWLDKPADETADWMREHVDKCMETVSGPRYAMLVQAVRVFEAKIARCKEGLANGDFFALAGTRS